MNGPSMGTTTSTDHQTAQSSYSLQYNETLAAGQKDFLLDEGQTDSASSEQTASGSSMSSDATTQSAHTFSMHQEATSDAQGQGFAFVSHAYDDARWTSSSSTDGQSSNSDVTTDTYQERMAGDGVGSFTEVRVETTSSTGGGMPGNSQTTTTTTSGTFTLGDPNHVAPGGPTSGTPALNQVFAQYQALGQQAALDLQRAIQACAASGRDSTGAITAGLQQVFNQLLPAVQGLPYKLRDMVTDRAGKVLLNVSTGNGVTLKCSRSVRANRGLSGRISSAAATGRTPA